LMAAITPPGEAWTVAKPEDIAGGEEEEREERSLKWNAKRRRGGEQKCRRGGSGRRVRGREGESREEERVEIANTDRHWKRENGVGHLLRASPVAPFESLVESLQPRAPPSHVALDRLSDCDFSSAVVSWRGTRGQVGQESQDWRSDRRWPPES
jgi:hypothetical protein